MSIFREAIEITDYFFKKTRGRFKYPYQSNKSEDYNITFSCQMQTKYTPLRSTKVHHFVTPI